MGRLRCSLPLLAGHRSTTTVHAVLGGLHRSLQGYVSPLELWRPHRGATPVVGVSERWAGGEDANCQRPGRPREGLPRTSMSREPFSNDNAASSG